MASYAEQLRAWAVAAGSDGCTGVPDFFVVCCHEHDHVYQTGETLRGVPQTKAEGDQRFRDCVQRHSPLRELSPLSWVRWVGVRVLGRGIWARRPRPSLAPREPLGVMDTSTLTEAQTARLAMLEELFT